MLKFITLSIFILTLIIGIACGGSETTKEAVSKDDSGDAESEVASQYGDSVFTIAKGEMSDRRKDHMQFRLLRSI